MIVGKGEFVSNLKNKIFPLLSYICISSHAGIYTLVDLRMLLHPLYMAADIWVGKITRVRAHFGPKTNKRDPAVNMQKQESTIFVQKFT